MVGRTFAKFRHSLAPTKNAESNSSTQLKVKQKNAKLGDTVRTVAKKPVDKSAHNSVEKKRNQSEQKFPSQKNGAPPTVSNRKSTSKPVELKHVDAGTTIAANRQLANLTGKPRKEQSSEKNASQPPEQIAYPRTEDVEIFPVGQKTFNHFTIPEDEFSAAAKGFVPSEASSKFEGLVDPSVTARFDKLSKNPSKDMLDAWAKHAQPLVKQSFSDVCKGLSTIPRDLAGSAEKWISGELSEPGEAAVTFMDVTNECPATVFRIATILNEESFIGKCPPKMQDDVRQLGEQYKELFAKLMDKQGVYQTSRACALTEARQPGFMKEIGVAGSASANKAVDRSDIWNDESEDDAVSVREPETQGPNGKEPETPANKAKSSEESEQSSLESEDELPESDWRKVEDARGFKIDRNRDAVSEKSSEESKPVRKLVRVSDSDEESADLAPSGASPTRQSTGAAPKPATSQMLNMPIETPEESDPLGSTFLPEDPAELNYAERLRRMTPKERHQEMQSVFLGQLEVKYGKHVSEAIGRKLGKHKPMGERRFSLQQEAKVLHHDLQSLQTAQERNALLNKANAAWQKRADAQFLDAKAVLARPTTASTLTLAQQVASDAYLNGQYNGKPIAHITISPQNLGKAQRGGSDHVKNSSFARDFVDMSLYLNDLGRRDVPVLTDHAASTLTKALVYPATHLDDMKRVVADPKVLEAWNMRAGIGFPCSTMLGFAGQFSGELNKIPNKMKLAMESKDKDGGVVDKQKAAQALVGNSAEWARSMNERIDQAKTMCRILNDPEFLKECPSSAVPVLEQLGASYLSVLREATDPDGPIQLSMAFAVDAAQNPEKYING